jgi:uncharacterized protein
MREQKLQPTAPKQRIASVDIVRGFALFGVLLVNMFNFGATFPVWTNPSDEVALSVMQIFFEYKSFRLFSFLFGFGIALQLAKSNSKGKVDYLFYIRRMTVLFVFGIINCLFYDGDVLMLYAEFGIVLLVFRKIPSRLLLLGWLVFNLHYPIERAINYAAQDPSEIRPMEERIEKSKNQIVELQLSHPYSIGSIGEVMAFNAEAIPPNPLENSSFFGMCLLGFYVARKRYFQEAIKYHNLIKKVFLWGLILGILAMAVIQFLKFSVGYSAEDKSGATLLQQLLGDLCMVFGSTLLSLGYASGLVLLSQSQRFKRYVSPLASVGRFALTTYLFQTFMFSTLFYGYGFDKGLLLGPFTVTMYAILFFIIQIIACNWWSRYFRFGPVEWLWRSASYKQWVQIRKEK